MDHVVHFKLLSPVNAKRSLEYIVLDYKRNLSQNWKKFPLKFKPEKESKFTRLAVSNDLE